MSYPPPPVPGLREVLAERPVGARPGQRDAYRTRSGQRRSAGRASGMAARLAGMQRAHGAATVSSPDYRRSARTLNPAINAPGAPWCQ